MSKVKKQKKVIILLSGGVDSTACIHYYLKTGFCPTALFIDYGQAAKEKEYESAKKVAHSYNIEFDYIKVEMGQKFKQGEISGRNAFFIIVAMMKYINFSGFISLGIHSGVPYYDCLPRFITDIKNLLDGYTDGKIRIDAPFLNWNKPMIYKYCKENKIPLELTYSCESGTTPPCGKCRSCLDRKALNDIS